MTWEAINISVHGFPRLNRKWINSICSWSTLVPFSVSDNWCVARAAVQEPERPSGESERVFITARPPCTPQALQDPKQRTLWRSAALHVQRTSGVMILIAVGLVGEECCERCVHVTKLRFGLFAFETSATSKLSWSKTWRHEHKNIDAHAYDTRWESLQWDVCKMLHSAPIHGICKDLSHF